MQFFLSKSFYVTIVLSATAHLFYLEIVNKTRPHRVLTDNRRQPLSSNLALRRGEALFDHSNRQDSSDQKVCRHQTGVETPFSSQRNSRRRNSQSERPAACDDRHWSAPKEHAQSKGQWRLFENFSMLLQKLLLTSIVGWFNQKNILCHHRPDHRHQGIFHFLLTFYAAFAKKKQCRTREVHCNCQS